MITTKSSAPDSTGQTTDTPTRKRPTSRSKTAANRRNSRKSTGPRTKAGKEKARKNALKHGLFASVLPLHDLPFLVDKQEYDQLIAQYSEDFRPATQFEVTLVESLAFDTMRLRHIHALEQTIWDSSRPSDREVEKWQFMIRMERGGMPVDEIQAEVALLEEFGKLLHSDKKPTFVKGDADRLAAMLEDLRVLLVEEVAQLQEDIKAPAKPPPEKAQIPNPFPAPTREQMIDHLKKCEGQLGVLGGSQPENTVLRTIRPLMSGKSCIPKKDVAHWNDLLYGMCQARLRSIRHVKQYRNNIQKLRYGSLTSLLSESQKLEVLNRYETMVRRNIDRTLRQLQQFRKLQTECQR